MCVRVRACVLCNVHHNYPHTKLPKIAHMHAHRTMFTIDAAVRTVCTTVSTVLTAVNSDTCTAPSFCLRSFLLLLVLFAKEERQASKETAKRSSSASFVDSCAAFSGGLDSCAAFFGVLPVAHPSFIPPLFRRLPGPGSTRKICTGSDLSSATGRNQVFVPGSLWT